jgi:DNA-binding transcriptional LysR family regulator
MEFPELFEREVDLVISPLVKVAESRVTRGITVEALFNDRFALVVGENSQCARRRKIKLADLVSEPWIMPPLDTLDACFATEAFTSAGTG